MTPAALQNVGDLPVECTEAGVRAGAVCHLLTNFKDLAPAHSSPDLTPHSKSVGEAKHLTHQSKLKVCKQLCFSETSAGQAERSGEHASEAGRFCTESPATDLV